MQKQRKTVKGEQIVKDLWFLLKGCWSWSSNTLASWCEELTHWKIPWCWERLRAGRGGGDRGWDGWMASVTRWTWVWVDSGSWWWAGRPGVLWFMGSQRVGHDWATRHAAHTHRPCLTSASKSLGVGSRKLFTCLLVDSFALFFFKLFHYMYLHWYIYHIQRWKLSSTVIFSIHSKYKEKDYFKIKQSKT